MKKVVLFLLDAFRSDYLSKENTPFLSELASKNCYVKSIIPSFGFCERTEIFCGVDMIESRYFGAFKLDPENSPYRRYKALLFVLSKIETVFNSIIISKLIRRFIWLIVRRAQYGFYPFMIPLDQLHKFALSEDGQNNLIENSANSLFKILAPVYQGTSTSMSSSVIKSDKARIDEARGALDGNCRLIPVYISELDRLGHLFGPESAELRAALKVLDKNLEEFFEYSRHRKDLLMVFCGDHGMSKVTKYINLMPVISSVEKTSGKKIDYFLDSTSLRVWSKDMAVMSDLCMELQAFHEFGGVHNQSAIDADFLWVCKEGVVIYPDFFNKSKVSGMHGYIPNRVSNFGMMISNSNLLKFYDSKPLTWVYDHIIEELSDEKK